MRNIKLFFYLYKPHKYFVFYPILGLSTAFFGTISVFLCFFINQKVGSLMGIVWARICSWATPMLVKTKGLDKIDKKQSYIIVANHQSLYDILVVYGWLPIDFKWVMKIQIKEIPFLGYACDKMGHIYIDRSNSQAALESINSAKQRIKNGTSVFFFPEGKRSDNGQMLPFKKGAFKFALDMGLPILPITINNTKNILPNHSSNLFPGKAEMIVHNPIETISYNENNIEALMEKTKQIIQKNLTNKF